MNITQLQITCTDLIFILAEVDVNNVFFISISFFGVLVLKFWVFFLKWGVRNKTAEKRLKMAIFKLLVLSYMHTTLYFSFFYSNNISKFYVVGKYKKKFGSTNMDLTHL